MLESDLLVTRFMLPPKRAQLLQRTRLLALLNQSYMVPLTLLAAPAGFGKTTLLASWASQYPGRVAWLTLEEQDNDPVRFWTYVIAALRHSGSPVGEATLAMLQTPQATPLTGALTSLINELTGLARDTALVLDDYHLLHDPILHASLQFLLDHLPPCLHLLLASRADPAFPLARLRARGQVVEIREADLRLRADEATGFLSGVMGLTLSEEDIACLETRTEGWIAGLQLAALSLRRHDNVSAFIQTFTGSHRFIQDYVQEEILAPLSDSRQRFLLQISVLERMNAELCQALTGEPNSQQILAELERANLFLVPLDEERRWYRFHTLFRDVLLARLQATRPEQIPQLHREAALWYQRQTWPHEAITHALAARDLWLVADLLEQFVEHLYLRGEVRTLLDWIKLLSPDVLRAHPLLATNALLAFNMLFPFTQQGQEEQGYLRQLLENAEAALQGEDDLSLSSSERERLAHRILLLKGWEEAKQALSNGNVEQMSRLARQIQSLALDDDTMWQQHRLAFTLAWRMAGNFPPMVAMLQEDRKKNRQVGQRYQEAQTLWGLIVALIALGKLHQARAACQELQFLVANLGEPLPVAAYPDLFLAQLAYAWNQLDAARDAARRAIEKTTALQYMDILMGAYEILISVSLAQGDMSEAEQLLGEMEGVKRGAPIPLFRSWLESLQAQLLLAQGDLKRAAEWATQTPYSQEPPVYSREGVCLTLARVSLATRRYPKAMQMLSALLNEAEQVEREGSVVAILALQVAALYASGATQQAQIVLSRLLTLAEPEGYLRIFLDAGEPMRQALQAILISDRESLAPTLSIYARSVLAAFASEPKRAEQKTTTLPATPDAQLLVEQLSQREMQVLHLLAEGASNQEIANRLVVSLATAKKHVASILSKLGVESRTQAIARARSLSLL